MKFLVDAQLPRRLCGVLKRYGHDATHTLDLPAGNSTTDPIINQVSLVEQRVVISKDADFFYSHVLEGSPWKLLLIKTGNISTQELCVLLEHNLSVIETGLESHTLVEIDRQAVTPRM